MVHKKFGVYAAEDRRHQKRNAFCRGRADRDQRSYSPGHEIGKNEPNLEALVSLADVYEVSLDYLMCRTDGKE